MQFERCILITGGAGFIGSSLCKCLLEAGATVLCVDNFFTGTLMNVSHLIGHPRLELMRQDVCFPLYVEGDEIYNMACPASPIQYQFDPVSDGQDQRPRRRQHAGARQAGRLLKSTPQLHV